MDRRRRKGLEIHWNIQLPILKSVIKQKIKGQKLVGRTDRRLQEEVKMRSVLRKVLQFGECVPGEIL